MKKNSDQAINDFCYAIYRIAQKDYELAGEPIEKANFFLRCLVIMNDLKMVDGSIIHNNQTLTYIVNQEKYTFWLVEVPEPNDKFSFVDYLTNEITRIFYNLDSGNFER